MLKRIMAVAAVSGLALTSALAQTTTPPASPSRRDSADRGRARDAGAERQHDESGHQSAATSPRARLSFVTKQTADQHLASKFKGTDVIGTDDAKIGDVSDMLFDKDHKIIAFIVGVGGFLGIGAKDVAIDPASFQAVPGKDATDTKLRLSMTKDELKAAPAFEPYRRRVRSAARLRPARWARRHRPRRSPRPSKHAPRSFPVATRQPRSIDRGLPLCVRPRLP